MVKPIRNNVVVQCFKTQDISEGGIIIPDSVNKESNKVKVVAVGEGTKDRPMRLRVGQVGFRVKDWGTPFEENGELYYLMDEQAIIATTN